MVPAVLISATARPPVAYIRVSGVTLVPTRPRSVANQSSVCARSSAAAAGATSPIAGLQSAPGHTKVGVVFWVESWMSASTPATQVPACQLYPPWKPAMTPLRLSEEAVANKGEPAPASLKPASVFDFPAL